MSQVSFQSHRTAGKLENLFALGVVDAHFRSYYFLSGLLISCFAHTHLLFAPGGCFFILGDPHTHLARVFR